MEESFSLYWVIENASHELSHLSTHFPIVCERVNPTTFLLRHWYHQDIFLRLHIQSERPHHYFNSPLSYRIMVFQKLEQGSCTYSTLQDNIPIAPITVLSIILTKMIYEYLLPYALFLKDEIISTYHTRKKKTRPLALLSFYDLSTRDIFVWNHYTVPVHGTFGPRRLH